MKSPAQIAAYYFPNYHADRRNEILHGPGWTEWDLVRRAEPRFPGHHQPLVPEWGYEDEADPRVMARKIDCAADHGIDTFIFDWYHYEDGPFLQRALDEGFLQAPNRERLQFALMWANHTWIDIHPAKASPDPQADARILYPGEVSARAFRELTTHCIEHYFREPNYWCIDGCPYFSIYDLSRFIAGLGGLEPARAALENFRQSAKKAGLPGLHVNAVLWDYTILPGEQVVAKPGELLAHLGIDSFSSYVWMHHVQLDRFPATPYPAAQRGYFDYWQRIEKEIPLPYLPNVTMGWDTSPRTLPSDRFRPLGYPFMATMGENTPANFGAAVKAALEKLATSPNTLNALTINAWNEWTEGSYLEPDTHNGLQYLEAIRQAKKDCQGFLPAASVPDAQPIPIKIRQPPHHPVRLTIPAS
ncbi:MAG: glycoside hydrolase family 99-like domain-containing protein [Opitutaceae bacterium]